MSIDCEICFRTFDLSERQPMSLPCGHTFCKACALSLNACPIDRAPFDKGKLVRNFMIVGLLDPESSRDLAQVSALRKCQTHGERIQIFCVDHREEICHDCLVKSHNGHQVRSFKDYMAMFESLKSRISKQQDHFADQSKNPLQEDRENLRKLIDQERSRVTGKLKKKIQAVTDSISNCCSKILSNVDEIFKMNERAIESLIKNSTILHNSQLSSLINQAGQSIHGLGKLSMAHLNKDVIGRIADTHALIEKIEAMQSKALHRKPVIDLPSVTMAISQNILDAFKTDCLFNNAFVSAMYSRPDLHYYMACNSPNWNSSKVIVHDPSLGLTRETLADLASACSPLHKFEIAGIQNSKGANAFTVSFEAQSDALSFLFFKGLSVNKSILNLKLADKDGKKLAAQLEALASNSSAKEKKSPDMAFESMIRLFQGRINDEVIQSYRQASVQASNFGFQSALFLFRLLGQIAASIKYFL